MISLELAIGHQRARLSHILELLEATVLCAGFDNSIGRCLVDRRVRQSIRRIGCNTRRVWNCPQLSLRRAKTACPEPTPANSLDL